MKLISNLLFIIIIFLTSCELKDTRKIKENISENITNITEKNTEDIKKTIVTEKFKTKKEKEKILYIVEDPYFIEGVEYIPEEDYLYSEKGLASFYDKELHNIKTINNEYNKVTELLGRHKTLPIPSIVEITNLENGLSLVIRVNDRHNDNTSIIQVSRKVAQLLRFYKNKIALVRIDILADASKQTKVVTQSMSDPLFDLTLESVPTENVIEIDLLDTDDSAILSHSNREVPIELNFEDVVDQNSFIKVYGFETYDIAKKIINELQEEYKITIEKDGNLYNIIIGSVENNKVKYLVSSFIAKGYKKTEIILE